MAETGSKIFDLDALVAIADDDVLVEVDVSDTTDSADGTNKKITVRDLLGVLNNGWIPSGETWSYSSVDDPTGIISCTDADEFLSAAMRISFVNDGNTIYGIITAVTSTTITFLHEIDPSDSLALHLMADSEITIPRYSTQKAPLDFPLTRDKWSVEYKNTANTAGAIAGTWTNYGSHVLSVPIGSWNLSYKAFLWCYGGAGPTEVSELDSKLTLSTANNSESDSEFTIEYAWRSNNDKVHSIYNVYQINKDISVVSKTSYYLNYYKVDGGASTLRGDQSSTVIRAECAYL